MKKIALAVFASLICIQTFAQESTNAEKPAPTQTPQTTPTTAQPTQAAATQALEPLPAATAPSKPLRKREFALTYELVGATTQVEVSSVKSKTTVSQGRIQFLRNTGHFEFGALASFYRTKNEDTSSETTSGNVAVIAHLNIIENRAGNDLVPYLSAGFGNLGMAVSNVDLQGAVFSTGGGLKWYPFSELFAFTAELSFSSGSISGNSVTARIQQAGLMFGWGIWF